MGMEVGMGREEDGEGGGDGDGDEDGDGDGDGDDHIPVRILWTMTSLVAPQMDAREAAMIPDILNDNCKTQCKQCVCMCVCVILRQEWLKRCPNTAQR